jgi:DNA-binding transcriptional LysR family regulator
MRAAVDWDDKRLGRHLKLRNLNVLLTVARCGRMGKAAAELALSQPAISKTIADMEFTLGVRLLDRSPQGVEPTIYARALLDRGLIAFDELRQAVKHIEYLADPTAGKLRIGCAVAIGMGFGALLARSFPAGIPALSLISWPPNRR